jgi:cell wall-associated NlpC family hydrolase
MAVAGRALVALLILGAFAGVGVVVDSHTATASSTQAQLIVSDAASQAGVPYCDGGGGINGPSNGGVVETGCGAGVKGFDCMSLVQYAVYQATGIILPDNGTQPEGVGTYIPPAATLAEDEAQVLPGDAVYWGGSGIDGFAHSGIYAGNDEVWDAVGPGIYVQTHTFEYLRETYNYDGAEQYASSASGLAITTTSLPSGSVYSKTHKVTYSTTLAATGGNAPYRWSLTKGSSPLPPGLKLHAVTGVISGRITATGTYSFTVRVRDTKTTTTPPVQHTSTKGLSISVPS